MASVRGLWRDVAVWAGPDAARGIRGLVPGGSHGLPRGPDIKSGERRGSKLVRQGIDRRRSETGDRGLSIRLEPIFDAIYELRDEEFLELVEELAFVYAYQHEGTEDSERRMVERLDSGVRMARRILGRDVGD